MPGLKSQREPEQRRQVTDHAKRTPGLRFRTKIWMVRVAKAWPRPCRSAVQAFNALDLAFPFRPLAMVVARILTALTPLVSMPWPSLGSPGSRDPMRRNNSCRQWFCRGFDITAGDGGRPWHSSLGRWDIWVWMARPLTSGRHAEFSPGPSPALTSPVLNCQESV